MILEVGIMQWLVLNVKANIKKKVQVYGQLMLDEFQFRELIKNTGSWANKFGYQLGVKYPDAFGIKTLIYSWKITG